MPQTVHVYHYPYWVDSELLVCMVLTLLTTTGNFPFAENCKRLVLWKENLGSIPASTRKLGSHGLHHNDKCGLLAGHRFDTFCK